MTREKMEKQDYSNNEFVRVISSYSNAISLLQKRTKITNETLLYILGEYFGNALANDISAIELTDILKETFSIWKNEGLGRGSIE